MTVPYIDPMQDIIKQALARLVPVGTEVVVWADLPRISDTDETPVIRVVTTVEQHYYFSPGSWGVIVTEPDPAGRVRVGSRGMVNYKTLYDLNKWLHQKAEIENELIVKDASPAQKPPTWYMVIDAETCGLLMFQNDLNVIFEEYKNTDFFYISRGHIDYRATVPPQYVKSWVDEGAALFGVVKTGIHPTQKIIIFEAPNEEAGYAPIGEDPLCSITALIKRLLTNGYDAARFDGKPVPLGIGVAVLLRGDMVTFVASTTIEGMPPPMTVRAYNAESRKYLPTPYADIYELEQFNTRKEVTA